MAAAKCTTKKLMVLVLGILVSSMAISATKKETKVIILGAGAAGIRAARQLGARNITDFIILDGSDQLGGLADHLTNFGGVTINTGDIFVWNENVAGLEHHLGLTLQPFTWNAEVRNDHNEDITDDYHVRYEVMDAARTAAYEDLAPGIHDHKRPDISAKAALAMKGWLASTPLDKITEWFDFQFNEGVAMEDMSFVGPFEQALLNEGVDDTWYFVTDYGEHTDGIYANLKETLLDGEHLHLNESVVNIDQSGDKVVVTALDYATHEMHDYQADYVLSTLSVGVLQHGNIKFEPPLPEWKTEQLCRFQSSIIEFVYLKFASKFWSDSEWILHASDHQLGSAQYWPSFLNMDREGFHPGSGILLAGLSKEEAVRVEGLTDEQIMAEIVEVLGLMYGDENVSELQLMKYDKWATNPAYYGIFVTWPIGANVPEDQHERFGARVGNVFFADSAGSAKHIGRQIGGQVEAERAVAEIVECMAQGECTTPEYEPEPYYSVQCEDDGQLYGCVKILKKEGKTRKGNTGP